jgi:hypothetical protein
MREAGQRIGRVDGLLFIRNVSHFYSPRIWTPLGAATC